MVQFAKEHNFSFPYVIDEDQTVAKSFGAVVDVYLYRPPRHAPRTAFCTAFMEVIRRHSPPSALVDAGMGIEVGIRNLQSHPH